MHQKIEELKEKYTPYINQNRRSLIVFFCAILVLPFLVWWLSPKPTQLRPVNVYARSISVAWVVPRPALGCVLSFKKSGLGLPRLTCSKTWDTVHLTEITNLEPEATYQLMVFSGLRPVLWLRPSVTTTAIQAEFPRMPQPGYGSVVYQDEKLTDALVLVYTLTNQPQYPVAALTNAQGNYAVDLANLSREGSSYMIDVFATSERSARLETDIRFSTPFPPIHVQDHEQPWWQALMTRLKGEV